MTNRGFGVLLLPFLLLLSRPATALTCMPVKYTLEVEVPSSQWVVGVASDPERRPLKLEQGAVARRTVTVFFDTLRTQEGKSPDCLWEPMALNVQARNGDDVTKLYRLSTKDGVERASGSRRGYRTKAPIILAR